MVLSAKHLLTTISEKIEFSDLFYELFTITAGEITPKIAQNTFEGNLDDLVILIKPEDIQKSEELDDDGSYNTFIKNGKFYIKNIKTKEEFTIQAKNDKEIFLTNECLDLIKAGKGEIKFKNITDETQLFVMEIMNNELTKPLYDIMNLLNKKRDKTEELTIDEICQSMVELMIESGIDAHAVQAELIINRLIRDVNEDNKYERPDFTKFEEPEYKIYTVTQALEHNRSPLLGISFQEIRRQLMNNDTFDKKNGESYLDPLFKPRIDTRRFKKYKGKKLKK